MNFIGRYYGPLVEPKSWPQNILPFMESKSQQNTPPNQEIKTHTHTSKIGKT